VAKKCWSTAQQNGTHTTAKKQKRSEERKTKKKNSEARGTEKKRREKPRSQKCLPPRNGGYMYFEFPDSEPEF